MRKQPSGKNRVYKPYSSRFVDIKIREEHQNDGRSCIRLYYKPTQNRKSWVRAGTVLDCQFRDVLVSRDIVK